MATGQLSGVVQHLRRTALARDGGGMTDGQLLECFITRRDEAAFDAFVRRHGPMVWGVCHRLLGHVQDAEDAFQATFLVLVRKATSIGQRELVGNWLYGAAYRAALEVKTARRRRVRERQVSAMPEPVAVDEADGWRDLRPVLDQELNRLPDKYRVPVVLCDLEGRTRREVARQLGIPEGTLSGRLTTARRLLAKRLARHGLALSAGALAALLAPNGASACVPAPLTVSTVKAVVLLAAGETATAVASANVAAIAEGVLKAMLMTKLKVMAAFLVVVLASWVFVTAGAGSSKEPPVSGGTPRAVVNVADFADPQSPTAGLQKAIDALPPTGGLVIVPSGEYLLRQSVHLRSNVTLQGAGGSTILRRGGQAVSKLTETAREGSSSVRVENAALFREGDEIGILDKESLGWNVGNAIVKGVRQKEVLLDRPLARSYDPAKGGLIVHCFPVFLASKASRLVVKDLVLDGRIKDKGGPTGYELSFKMAAIHLIDATDSRIEACQILGWASDGISFSRGWGHAVVRCLVQDCGGHGFHPGGGVRDSVFSENVARGNGRDGLYFCMKVRHVIVSNNVFVGNKGHGIGGLGDSGDKYNVVTGNVCRANGANGICLVDGDNNSVTNNICINNSQASPGRYSGILLNKTAETIVTGNRCLDDQETKTQKHGILEFSSCRANLFGNNLCRGNAQSGLALAGQGSQQSGNME